jgi:hypothetical protein
MYHIPKKYGTPTKNKSLCGIREYSDMLACT